MSDMNYVLWCVYTVFIVDYRLMFFFNACCHKTPVLEAVHVMVLG
jgi:hypothetical protein